MPQQHHEMSLDDLISYVNEGNHAAYHAANLADRLAAELTRIHGPLRDPKVPSMHIDDCPTCVLLKEWDDRPWHSLDLEHPPMLAIAGIELRPIP